MRNSIIVGAIGAALGLVVLAGPASAECSGATTGTIVGGVGGALIGNAVSHNAGGVIIGGLGGAVVGHEIGKSGCGGYSRSSRGYRYERRARQGYDYAPVSTAPPSVYYDSRGRQIYPNGSYVTTANTGYGAYAPAPCTTQDQVYYDERGALAHRTVQVCSR